MRLKFSHIHRKSFQHLSWVLALSIACALFIPPAQADIETHQYITKLVAENPEVLESVGYEVEPVFPNSPNAELQNIFRFTSSEPASRLAGQLGGLVTYLEEDDSVHAAEAKFDDPWFTTNALDVNRQWYLQKARFHEAWETKLASRSVVVAVLDTGIDATHEDLDDIRYVRGYDFLAKREIAPRRSRDNNGHGTLVAGVLAATANNGIGIVGAAHGVSIMPLLGLDKNGIGRSSVIAEAIVWAADHGADIINLSLSDTGSGHDITLSNAIAYAFNKGALLVAAAGNDSVTTGVNLDADPLFPICDDNGENMVLGVTATDYRDNKPDFANYGKSCIDVSAPGKRIISTVNIDPRTREAAPDSYAYASGTSLAVPLVSAEAALLKSLYPDATNKQIRDLIIATSDRLNTVNLNCGETSCAGFLGAGRINAARAVTEGGLNERIVEGSLVQTPSGALYFIYGGKRQPVSLFVREQRFKGTPVVSIEERELELLPVGAYAEPLEGTLLKSSDSPTVFYMGNGIRRPVTGQVFTLRAFSFANVFPVSPVELNSWVPGPFLTPPEGTLVRTQNNPTVYWVMDNALHPVSAEFYSERGLSALPIVTVSDSDLRSFPIGEPYIL